MSVLIENMNKPKNCAECCFSVDGWCYVCAPQSEEERKRITSNYCPLVEIPPHGRLIDADELRWFYDNSDVADDVITKENYDQLKVAVAVVRQTIDDAPTIIPAEEAKDV